MNAGRLVARRLSALAPLDPGAVELIAGLSEVQRLGAGVEIVHDQDPLRPRFLVSGWAARVRWLADGRRQIVGFLTPGDGLGLCERPQPLAVCPVVAISPVELVEASALAHLAFGKPGARQESLSIALHISAALEEAALMDQIVRLGRQTALERIAHLFLELRFRLNLVGLVDKESFSLPLTQEQLADATGLSAVHVNRTLQQLRREGLLELASGRLRLLEPDLLQVIADYRTPQVTRWAPEPVRREGGLSRAGA